MVLALGLLTPGCEGRNRGISPVGAGLYFPSGIALDPRVPRTQPARWLFVLNGNSDLVYNAGSLVPVDLDAFFAAWMIDPDACFAGDAAACRPGTGGIGDGVGPVIGDVGEQPTEEVPCRRNAYKPQVIECEDTFFLEDGATVHLGNFGTALTGWTRDPVGDEAVDEGKLFVAVRGDPSITYIDLEGDPDEVPELDCGQGPNSGTYDEQRCAGGHLLRFLRDDEDAQRIPSEPSNILATPGSSHVLVTHATSPALTLIDMDGQYDAYDKSSKDRDPAIVQMRSVFEFGGTLGGGWGLALRPCTPGDAPVLTIGPGPDGAPTDCQRPLIYAGFRTALYVARVFISETEPLASSIDLDWLDGVLVGIAAQIDAVQAELGGDPGAAQKQELEQQLAELIALQKSYTRLKEAVKDGEFDQRCLLADDIAGGTLADDVQLDPPTTGAFLCDARLFAAGLFRAAAFDTGLAGSGALLGDLAFSRGGDRLFATQTNPGGLAYIDTSLDSEGLTRDQTAGMVELCAQPTGLRMFFDGENEYAAVTCYKPQEMFIVDLGGLGVIANVSVGNGPHPMAVDPARNLMYIANTLDKTVSVVDLSPKRPTRFVEIARIGRQVPYNR